MLQMALLTLHYTKGRTNNHLDVFTFAEKAAAVCRCRLMDRAMIAVMIARLMIRESSMIADVLLLFLTRLIPPSMFAYVLGHPRYHADGLGHRLAICFVIRR